MSRKPSTSIAATLHHLMDSLLGIGRQKAKRRAGNARGYGFESLEGRSMLAADLGSIAGLVYQDVDGDGYEATEAINGGTVALYVDDGDGVFEPSAGDTSAGTTTTDVDGNYQFGGLIARSYWVHQPSQPGNTGTLPSVARLVNITATQAAQGQEATLIDEFDATSALITDTVPVDGAAATGQVDAAAILGGELDLSAKIVTGPGTDNVAIQSGSGVVQLSSTSTGDGEFVMTWDGNDSSAALNPIGLQTAGVGIDLTANGGVAFRLLVQSFDQAGGTARIRVHTDGGNSSVSALVNIPTGAAQDLSIRYSNFIVSSGTGADFTDVGAIELEVFGAVGMDGQIGLTSSVAEAVVTQDFPNEQADLSLTLGVDNATPDKNDQVTFTITVTNGGTGDATGVQVLDQLPAGVTFVSANPSQGTYTPGTGIWNVGSIADLANATLDIVATVTTVGAKTNTAQVSASNEVDPDSTPNNSVGAEDDQASILVTPQQSNLSVTKDVDNASPDVGENVTFTITVANAGPDNATGVVVSDLLPTGLTFSSKTVGQGTYDELTGVWTIGTINNGANAILEIIATVASVGTKTNDAEVTASDQLDPNSTPGNDLLAEDDQDDAVVTPVEIDLSLGMIVSDNTPGRNQLITYTLTLANAGPDNATGITVTDLLPAGVVFDSFVASVGTYNDTTGVWTVGSLASGADETLDIVGRVTTTGVKTNTAQVTTADQGDGNSIPGNSNAGENDQASSAVTPTIANLTVTKIVTDQNPPLGGNVTFTITVDNAGPDAATNVSVLDLLPAGMSLVSELESQGTYTSGTGVWNVGTIASGADATLTIVATVVTSGAKVNTAELTAADPFDPDSTPGNGLGTEDDQDSVTVTPGPQVDLSLTKSVNDTTPDRNQNITYTLTVANAAGFDDATGVVVTDLLPAGLQFVSSTVSQGSYDSGTGVWTVGAIDSGDDATLTVTVTVTTSGVKTNTAQITAAGQADLDSTPGNSLGTEDDQDSETVTPNVANLSLTKTVTDDTPDRNQQVTFLLTVSNAGTQTGTGINVSDVLPAGLTFVSSTPSQGTYTAGTGLWTVGSVASGANATLSIVATVATSGAKTNTAQIIAADAFDPNSTPNNSAAGEDDQASAVVTPNVSDLSLIKSVNNGTPAAGQNITFTLTLSNAGPQTATGVNVLDPLPSGLTFVSSTPSVGTYSSTTGIWNVGSLNSGSNATLQIVATVSSGDEFTTSAQVSSSDGFDPDSTPGNSIASEDDQDSVAVDALRLSKRRFLAR